MAITLKDVKELKAGDRLIDERGLAWPVQSVDYDPSTGSYCLALRADSDVPTFCFYREGWGFMTQFATRHPTLNGPNAYVVKAT